MRRSWFQIAELNWEPRSVVMSLGTPNEANQPWANASMTDSVVMSRSGMAVGQRENRSMVVRRYEYPFYVGTMAISAWMCSNRRFGTSKWPISGTTFLPTFARWHSIHSRAHFEQSARRDGHTNLAATICLVLSTPG